MLKKLLTLMFVCIGAYNACSQTITNYNFSASAGTYTALSGGTVPSVTSGTPDEGFANSIPIGFDFWYMGTRYTTIAASSNGWLSLGGTITAASPTNNLNSGGTPRPVLAPLWDDLNVQATTNITYLTSGTAGSRIFTIEYLNIKWLTGATGNTISFQTKLYEGTGRIEYIYRQESGALNNPSASIGIAATANGSGQFLSVNPSGTAVSSTTESTIIAKPISGNTYAFASPIPAAPASLIFSTVNSTSMTLNWSDLSSNETGFVIYKSTDNITYTFASQTAANATSSVQSGLTANTLYYWKIYAVSEGGLSSTALAGSQTASCTPPSAPAVTSPVNYCQNATATALTATGSNLLWGGASGTVGGTTALTTSTGYVDNNFNNRKTNITTANANVKISTVDYYIPAFQSVNGLVLSIYNSGGTVIATSTTTTTITAGASPVQISNTFNYTITAAGNYSIGVSAGTGNIGADNPTFPITESTGSISITGVSSSGYRCFTNIQFTNLSSASAPTPATTTLGSFTYYVSQTVGGCTSAQASIVVNVTTPNLSQIPTSNLIANYKFAGNALDDTGNDNGTLQGSPTATTDRFGRASNAYSFNGSSQYVSTANVYVNPTNFTISIWFKTSSITGGKLIGFGASQTGSSSQYDRHIYMTNTGQLYFGIYNGSVFTVNTTTAYNDNVWHQAVGVLSSTSGMSFYVDGTLVGTNPSATTAENTTGYWRIAYDNTNGWTSQPTSYFFSGTLDDALIYHQALTPAEVATIYTNPDGAGNNGPACIGSSIGLTAKTIGGATYSWTGPNSFTSSSQNPTFTYAAANAGTYTVQVTAGGCTSSAYTNVVSTTNAGQWTGNVSTDWATAGNWCTGVVPSSTTNVIISSASVRMPVVISSVSCKNLTINSGATITTSAAGTLNIAGTLLNNGTMINSGTTVFNGTSGQQTFSGVTAFTNLTVNNTSGLLLPAAITAANITLAAGGLLSSGNFNIALNGTWTNNVSTSAFTAGTATVTFSGSTAQSISGSFATTFNNLIIAGTANTVTLGVNASVAGNLTVSSGIFDLSAFTANRTASGGVLMVANNSTLKIGGTNTFPANYTTNTLSAASTVEYSGTAQTVGNVIYGNLTFSSSAGAVIKTLPATALSVVGNFTTALGAGTGVTVNAGAAITIGGVVTLATSTTFDGGSFSHSAGGNWINNGTFTGNASTVTFTGANTSVSGTGAQNFFNLTIAAALVNFTSTAVTVSGNLATSGSGSTSQTSGATMTLSGTTKTISGTGITLDNLSVSGTVTTTSSITLTGNLTVAGTLTATSGSFTMSGASKTITGAGTKSLSTLITSGSITTAVNLTITTALTVSGSFSASAGTVTFTGTSVLSGTANLFLVVVNGTSLQLSANATLGVSSSLTISTGTLNTTSSLPNTVNFNGTGAQNVNAITYSNLIMSGGNTKTALGAITTMNDITVAASTTFAASTFTHSINGNWNNNGTFTPSTGTIQFTGATTSYITGATTFGNLTINMAGASTEVLLQSNVTTAIVNMTKGVLQTQSNTINITNTRTGNSYIYGNIQRTTSFASGTAYAFEGPDNLITFTLPIGITTVTVSVVQGAISDFPSGASISRLYTVTIPSGIFTSAAFRLHYEDAELNGNVESSMTLWHYNGTAWSSNGKSSNSATSNYVELTGIGNGNLTNRWTISSATVPGVVQWTGTTSTAWNTATNWTVVSGSASRPPAATDIVYLGNVAFTNHPTISSAVTVKNILFGSAQALNLTIGSGGSLTSGDIGGTWSSSLTHSLIAGNQNVTINGNLTLSDGTAGHAINLSIGTGTVTVNSLTESGGANVTFSGGGNLNIADDFTYGSGTFTPSTGTVTYNGTVNQSVGPVNYYNLTINKSAGLSIVNNPTAVGGDLKITAGELDNSSTIAITGNMTLSAGAALQNSSILQVGGNWSNLGTYTTVGSTTNVMFNGAGAQSISATTFDNLEFNKPVGTTATLTGDVILKGNLVGTSGTLDIGTFNFNRDVTGGTATITNNGTLIIGADNAPTKFSTYSLGATSTVIFNGVATQHLALPGLTYGNIVFRNAGQKLILTPIAVTTKLLIESTASVDGGANVITLNGDWQTDGTFTPATSSVVANGTSKNITGVTTFNQLTVNGSYTINNNVTFNGMLTISSSGSLTGGSSSILVTLNGDFKNSGTLNNPGTTTFTGTVAQTLSLINAVSTFAATVNFNGSVSPILNSTSTPTYGILNINNTGGVNPSVDWAIQISLSVGSGASFNSGATTQNIYGSVTNNGTITSSGVINIIPVSPTVAAVNLGTAFTSTGKVEFGGTGTITFAGSALTFSNVVISNSNAAGISPAANWTIGKDFTINSGSIFNAGAKNYSVAGNLSSAGTLNSGTSTFILNGASAQTISSASAFNNFTTNNSSGTINLASDITINSSLTFNGGKIVTGIYKVIQPVAGTLSGSSTANGWVAGNLQKGVSTGAGSKNFEIGDVSTYTPLVVNFANVTTAGGIILSTTPADHPSISGSNINPSKSVNRYWSLTAAGIVFTSYTITTNWVSGDVDAGANPSSFKVALFNQNAWTSPTSIFPTPLSIQATGVTLTGDIAVGENCNSGTTIAYSGTPFCTNGGTASVMQTGNTGGTYTSTTGLTINAATGAITLASSTAGSYVVKYTLAASGGCSVFFTTANVTVTTAPSATISYSGTPYCSSSGTAVATLIGTSGGAFTSTTGLVINASNGSVDLASSTAGSYTVTYTISAAAGCSTFTTTAPITITTQPFANGSYVNNPYCSNAGFASPTGTASGMPGTLSSTPGLVIDANTGVVNLGTSTAGTYTVTYSVAASGGCSAYSTTSTIAITQAPSATISYASPQYCTTVATVPVIFSGTTGGTYSASPAGLTIDASTGALTPTASSGGSYTVTYSIPAANGCPIQTATANVQITQNPSATISYPGSPYTAGSGSATVTLTGTTGGVFSSTAGLVLNSSTGSINLVTTTKGTYTVTYAIAASGGCALFSTTASVVIVYNIKTWDGGAGTINWADAQNWNPDGVPIATDDVNLTTASTIVVNTAAIARDLVMNNAGLTLTVGAINSLSVSGDITITAGTLASNGTGLSLTGNWSNSAAFTANTSTVTFNGATTQQIGGSAVTDFYNIALTNTASVGATVESNQKLHGVLTLASNATFDADGTANTSIFTLISGGDEPTLDAAIEILPSGAKVTGNVTVQRYMTKQGGNNKNIYRYISSAVQNGTVADIQNEIPITGTFTGASSCAGCRNKPSLFYYDETVTTDISANGTTDLNDGYIKFPTSANTETLTPGLGYTLYTRASLLTTTLWDIRGIINAGNVTAVTLPTTYTSTGSTPNDGWNFVGNPFPSTIDWNAASGWTKTNLGGSIYISDNGTASLIQYATWNGTVGTNGGSRYISTAQGFWVKANGPGSPVLTATENVKVPGTQTTFFRQGPPVNLLRITMIQDSVRDESVIHFRDDATANFDAETDALKLENGTFNFATLSAEGTTLAINSQGSLNCNAIIKLSIANTTTGNYKLNFSELASFPSEVRILLEDKFTSASFDVRQAGSYPFSVTSDAGSFGTERFSINFLMDAVHISLSTSGDSLVSNFLNGNQWYLDSEPIANANTKMFKPTTAGLYTLKVTIGNCANTAVYEYAVTGLEKPIDESIVVYPNPTTKDITISFPANLTGSDQVMVLNSLGIIVGKIQLTTIDKIKSGTADFTNLPAGVYLLQLALPNGRQDIKIIRN